MKKHFLKTTVVTLLITLGFMSFGQIEEKVVLGYFPSWSEDAAMTDENSKLREMPEYVNYVFLAFAKPNLRYEKGSHDITNTGIQVPYDGCGLKESVSALRDKGIHVILSIGGETYWNDTSCYEIDYEQIKDLVDDIGFAGIDWDYEPSGSFQTIGYPENVAHFIDFFNKSRSVMPRDEGYLIACAPSGVGALGGQLNDDPDSPFAYSKRNEVTGETDEHMEDVEYPSNGINLFGFSSTGHMIPVLKNAGESIDLIAFQGYNVGASLNRAIMYESYAYYAEQYGFTVAAGVHFPPEPWGAMYTYTPQNVAILSNHIKEYPSRIDDMDGIMIWQILLTNDTSSAYAYMNVASRVLGGETIQSAINNANNFSMSPYEGGAEGCEVELYCGYPEYNVANTYKDPNKVVYYECSLWRNRWWANPGEIPGEAEVWEIYSPCTEGPGCEGSGIADERQGNVYLSPNPAHTHVAIYGLKKPLHFKLFDKYGKTVLAGELANEQSVLLTGLHSGIYHMRLENGMVLTLVKIK